MAPKTANFIGIFKSLSSLNSWTAIILLLTGLASTILLTINTKKDVEALARQEFNFASSEITVKIEDRLNAHAQILYSAAALFAASSDVNRQEWRSFAEHTQFDQHLPGIQGLGFSKLIPPSQRAANIQQIHSEGFPDYEIWPTGEREIYTSIIYLEPFSGRNLRAFGYDMFSEPIRRAAMERARDQKTAALSGKVVLVQETNKDTQPGTLLYVPVYRNDLPTETVTQRRAALLGWVYSPYRMNDLMQGILFGWNSQAGKSIHLEIYDGNQISTNNLLYNSLSLGAEDLNAVEEFTQLTPIDFSGQRWTLRFTHIGKLATTLDYSRVWVIFISGIIINFLLFILVLSLMSTRANALQMAARLTVDLRLSEEKFRAIVNSADDMVFTLDHNHQQTGLYGHWAEKVQQTTQIVEAEPALENIFQQSGAGNFEAN